MVTYESTLPKLDNNFVNTITVLHVKKKDVDLRINCTTYVYVSILECYSNILESRHISVAIENRFANSSVLFKRIFGVVTVKIDGYNSIGS